MWNHHGLDGLEKGTARVSTSGLLKAKCVKHQSQQHGALWSERCPCSTLRARDTNTRSHSIRPTEPGLYPKCIEGGWAQVDRAVGPSRSPGSPLSLEAMAADEQC